MRVLVVDVGGTNVKVLATGQKEPRKFPSGSKMRPTQMVAGVKQIAGDWKYDGVAIGYPGPVLNGKPAAEPRKVALINLYMALGGGWNVSDADWTKGPASAIPNSTTP